MLTKREGATHRVRQPAVAGMFYPADVGELRALLESFLQSKEAAPAQSAKAYILPHAGYVYSGPIAGTGYACLRPERDIVKRVILLGPSHRVSFHGLAVAEAEAFSTPLGEVPLDQEAIEGILRLPQVKVLDAAHAGEHSLEVHLPFLQLVLSDFKLVPLVVGNATADEVSEVLERLWGGAETRVIISSDLSHYHECREAQEIDRNTADRIESLRPVNTDQACGAIPIGGLLHVARRRGLRGRTIDLRNSGETAGPRNRVVGYGAFVFN